MGCLLPCVFQSGVYPDFGVVNFEIWRKPYLPLGAADVVGFGLAQDKFRVDEELRFKFIVDGRLTLSQTSMTKDPYSNSFEPDETLSY